MAKVTPMMEQYLQIKEQAQDAFLFFRLGDFYELFFEDAILAAKELEITLTGRGKATDSEERIPMCGVPYHSSEQYVMKLIEKGYKVAICEQMEDPALAKGVVKREIVRIVTPGTVMEDKGLTETNNNFIVALAASAGYFALTACDVSTGELYHTEIEDTLERLMDEVMVYRPAELLCASAILPTVQALLGAAQQTTVVSAWENADEPFVREHFAELDFSDYSPAAISSIALLLTYVRETQKRSLLHMSHIERYAPQQYMTLDPFTRRNLELTETVRERSKKGSLLWLLDQTVTALGGRLLRRWVDKPLLSQKLINDRLEAVEKLYHSIIYREEMRTQLKQVYDLERLVGRIAFGNANARDLLALKHSLVQVPSLLQQVSLIGSDTLSRLTADADDCQDIWQWLEQALLEDPPLSVKDGGMMREGYHERLDQLREAAVNGKQWIAELEQSERKSTGIKSLKVGFNKVFGYYIEVTKSNLQALPEGHYERKQTLANAERFITPELKEKEALILDAQEHMVDLEYELFSQLREKLVNELPRLQQLANLLAALDVYQALATISAKRRYVKPVVGEPFELKITSGRHPVVEAMAEEEEFISNDAWLNDEHRMLLITGPNMAGKSTYMRQVALISIMAQIGCFVPAEAADIPIIDRIFTRIGAADDLIGGQSTFMVEMKDIQIMTEKATAQSLLIIDELGRGTSTGEGMAIAQAVIEYIHHHIGCKTLVSTHFHELAHLEGELAYLKNVSMAVKESGDQVAFLRKLVDGAASTSYGIYCAQIAGLDRLMIDRAYELLQQHEPTVHRHETVAAARETAASAEQERQLQLSLFPELAEKPAEKQSKPEGEVLKALARADVMNMTPLQAMQMLNELKQKLKKD